MKLNRKTMKWMLFGLCFVVFATWAALMWGIFRDKPEETPPKEKTPNENKPTVTKEPTVSPPPAGMTEIFLLERHYETIDGQRRLVRTFRYDDDGRLLACAYEGEDGEFTYEYWEDFHLLKEQSPIREVYAGEKRKTETVYGANGIPTITATYRIRESDGSLETIAVTEWDEAGNMTRSYHRGADGDSYRDDMTEYDGNGYVIRTLRKTSDEEEWFPVQDSLLDEEGRVLHCYTIEGKGDDALATLTMEISYGEDGSREETRYIAGSVYTRRLDASGREVYVEWYDGSEENKDYQIINYTEENGEITRESKYYRNDGTLVNTLITRYDEQGHIIFQKRTEADGTEILFDDRTRDEEGNLIVLRAGAKRKLEYDSHGNLIRITFFNDEKVYRITEFEYTSVTVPVEVAEENAKYYNPATEVLNEWYE